MHFICLLYMTFMFSLKSCGKNRPLERPAHIFQLGGSAKAFFVIRHLKFLSCESENCQNDGTGFFNILCRGFIDSFIQEPHSPNVMK